jgi:hypothetical protein
MLATHAAQQEGAQHASAVATGFAAVWFSAGGAQPQVDKPPLASPSFVSAPL